jgi:hypothetical protein
VSTVRELFRTATDREVPKVERKIAFSQLRNISLFSDDAEAQEARLALDHSRLYQSFEGDMTELKKIVEKLSLAPGITQKTADEETTKLRNLFSQIAEKLDAPSSTSNEEKL